MRLTFAGNIFVSLQGRNIFPLKNPTNSLRAIFSTDAGQLSDSLKSFAGQNKYLQDCRQLCCRNIIFFSKIHRTFVRQTFCRTKRKFTSFVLHFSWRLPKGLRKRHFSQVLWAKWLWPFSVHLSEATPTLQVPPLNESKLLITLIQWHP